MVYCTVVTGGSRAAKRVFLSMLDRVLHAPMSYFETTPMGRTLNRFTYDMEVVDMTLTEAMSVLLVALGWGVTAIVVMCTILPWMALAIFPITVLYWLLLLHYRKSGADLQRLDAVARSPIQAMLAEGMFCTSTVYYTYNQQESAYLIPLFLHSVVLFVSYRWKRHYPRVPSTRQIHR